MILQQDPNKQQENRNFCEDTANSNKPMMEPNLQPQNLDFCEDAGKSNIPQKVLDCCEKQNAKHFPLKEVQTESSLANHDEWLREMNADRIRQSPHKFLEEEVNLAWAKVKRRGNNKAGHIIMEEIEQLENNRPILEENRTMDRFRQGNSSPDKTNSILLEEDKTIDRFRNETPALNIFMAKKTELNQMVDEGVPNLEEEALPIQCVDVPTMKIDIEGVTFRVIPDTGAGPSLIVPRAQAIIILAKKYDGRMADINKHLRLPIGDVRISNCTGGEVPIMGQAVVTVQFEGV
ncbi:MAG: hypothetical protein GY816_07825 [Cytophagales bacterium]|nr:hypothetical protein [Cytophagales bacterium]